MNDFRGGDSVQLGHGQENVAAAGVHLTDAQFEALSALPSARGWSPILSMNGTSTMLRRIVFPVDSSPRSEHAVRYAAELASAADARLVLMRADQPAHHAAPGHAHDALVDEIDRQEPDLVIMATDGHSGARFTPACCAAPIPMLASGASTPAARKHSPAPTPCSAQPIALKCAGTRSRACSSTPRSVSSATRSLPWLPRQAISPKTRCA
jgi:hypothetical protein